MVRYVYFLIAFFSLFVVGPLSHASVPGDKTPGFNNRAGEFVTADTAYLSIADATQSGLDFSGGDFTFAFWIYNDSRSDTGYVFSKYVTAGGHRSYYCYKSGTVNYQCGISDNGGGITTVTTNEAPRRGTDFVVFSYDATAQEITVSVNDNTPSTTAFAGTLKDTTAAFEVGRLGDASGYLTGAVMDLAAWSRELTPAEITELHNEGRIFDYSELSAGLLTGLVSHWQLDEESDGTAPVTRVDSHGSNDLTDNNTTASRAVGMYTDDSDDDGYRKGTDCDDYNRRMYPGRYWQGATSADVYDYAQCDPLVADGGGATGEYVNEVSNATDSANFFTCHSGTGETIFIDPVAGDNADSGLTPALAYADFTNLHRTTGSNPFAAGDCIVLLRGATHSFAPMTDGSDATFPLRITDGTSADRITLREYPGHEVLVDSGCDNVTPCAHVYIASADYITVSGISFEGSYGSGIEIEDAISTEIKDVVVYGTRGADDTSILGGVEFTRCNSGCSISHSVLYDNHKATSNATNIQNSANVVSVDSEYSLSYLGLWYDTNTLAVTSGGRNVFIKHNDTSSTGTTPLTHIQALNGYNANYWFSGPVTATHLLGVTPGDSDVRFEDGGDPSSEIGGSITYSTFTGGDTPVFVKTDDADNIYTTHEFQNNVVTQDDSTYGIVRMSRFDATNLDTYLAAATYDNNCYYDATSLSFELAASDGGSTYGSLAAWQAATFIGGGTWGPDANSFDENPNLDGRYAAQSANCSDKGWTENITYLDLTIVPTVDTLVTSDTTPELTGTLGTANPAATVQVTVDESVYAATNNGDGTWTLADDTITPPLLGGRYDVVVQVTDPPDLGSDATLNELTIDISLFGWAGSFLSRACGGCF